MSERERWAYEELQPDDVIQEGDQWLNPDGRWQAIVLTPEASMKVGEGLRVRRPHNITMMLAAFASSAEVLADAQQAATQLQSERDEFQTAMIESRLALKRKVAEVMEVCKERDDACRERDLARAEVARLSTELWARKPLEDRVAALTDEVTQLRAERQEWIDRCDTESVRALRLSEQLSAAEVAVKSAQRARDELQRQVDELREQQSPVTPADQSLFYELTEKRIASLEDELSQVRADRDKLQGLIDDLVEEPTARQVQDMLRTWATELDWSAGCFDSVGRDKVSAMQRVLVVVIERIESIVNPEAGYADA